jgi:hypothetical protein
MIEEPIVVPMIRRLMFGFPETRPDQGAAFVGEGFEVDERKGDSVEALSDGTYRIVKQIYKTTLKTGVDKKQVQTLVATGRFKTITIRPVYLWVEEEANPAPVD